MHTFFLITQAYFIGSSLTSHKKLICRLTNLLLYSIVYMYIYICTYVATGHFIKWLVLRL